MNGLPLKEPAPEIPSPPSEMKTDEKDNNPHLNELVKVVIYLKILSTMSHKSELTTNVVRDYEAYCSFLLPYFTCKIIHNVEYHVQLRQ